MIWHSQTVWDTHHIIDIIHMIPTHWFSNKQALFLYTVTIQSVGHCSNRILISFVYLQIQKYGERENGETRCHSSMEWIVYPLIPLDSNPVTPVISWVPRSVLGDVVARLATTEIAWWRGSGSWRLESWASVIVSVDFSFALSVSIWSLLLSIVWPDVPATHFVLECYHEFYRQIACALQDQSDLWWSFAIHFFVIGPDPWMVSVGTAVDNLAVSSNKTKPHRSLRGHHYVLWSISSPGAVSAVCTRWPFGQPWVSICFG